MQNASAPVIWLAYVSYPVTTAVYLERALRRSFRVITCGPKIGPDVIKMWNLQNMKLPVVDLDITLPPTPDMREVCSAVKGQVPMPDLYLWVESVSGYHPTHLDVFECPKACFLIDSHLNLEWHLQWAAQFDFVFVAQREYVPEFLRHGCKHVFWLPLACDPEIHAQMDTEKRYDVGFVGSVFEGSRRAQLLHRLSDKRLLVWVERCFWNDMALLFSRSRIVFNNSVKNDLNMRVFEAMSTGSFLLTDRALNSGQDELFRDGEDLGIYEDEQLPKTARHYLVHEEEREEIARRGQAMVRNAHTYEHRCAELVNVCFGRQASTPSAGEWRERSLKGVPAISRCRTQSVPKPSGCSFIIPVLYATPEGKQDFEALLSDLSAVDGEVIAVFNSLEAAALFRDHPRIDLFASLNVNAGVPRAWNIGVHLSTQPTLIFVNVDVRLTPVAIHQLERALWELPSAGIVGPEGSFFGFYTYEDIMWFGKGALKAPRRVDAVSGFLFATKRELFLRKMLQFEDGYTPCFAEEWDLALQARQHGYLSYAIPLDGYEHKWGVSRDMDKEIRFMKNQQGVARQIGARNRIAFWRKWLAISGKFQCPGFEPNGPVGDPLRGSDFLQSGIVNEPDLMEKLKQGT